MFRGPAVDEMMQRHKPKRGKHTSFPPTFHGQVIKQWTVKSDADYPGSWYTRTCALKPEIKEAITCVLARTPISRVLHLRAYFRGCTSAAPARASSVERQRLC
jgi:hypothetical protein